MTIQLPDLTDDGFAARHNATAFDATLVRPYFERLRDAGIVMDVPPTKALTAPTNPVVALDVFLGLLPHLSLPVVDYRFPMIDTRSNEQTRFTIVLDVETDRVVRVSEDADLTNGS